MEKVRKGWCQVAFFGLKPHTQTTHRKQQKQQKMTKIVIFCCFCWCDLLWHFLLNLAPFFIKKIGLFKKGPIFCIFSDFFRPVWVEKRKKRKILFFRLLKSNFLLFAWDSRWSFFDHFFAKMQKWSKIYTPNWGFFNYFEKRDNRAPFFGGFWHFFIFDENSKMAKGVLKRRLFLATLYNF